MHLHSKQGFTTKQVRQERDSDFSLASARRERTQSFGFTTKQDERQTHVPMRLSETSAGRKAVLGFTLVEMLIAVFIMSMAAGFVTIVTGSIKVTRDSAFESVAFRVAGTKLDELRAGGYEALPAEGSFSVPELDGLPQGAASTSIADLNADTKRVMAGVSWRGADDTERVVSLTTLITRTGGL